MYEDLLSLLAKPALWQRTAAPFWDDPHISEGMLRAHLDPMLDAASRRAETVERSAEWLCSVLPARCRVIDLGCGPGLYTKRLAARGFRTAGVDLSQRSIDYARAQDSETQYLCGSYLTMEPPGVFDAALMIYCDYAALVPTERQALLENVSRMLAPDGVFLFDVYTPAYGARDPARGPRWSLHEKGGFWSAAPHLLLEQTHSFEGGTAFADQHIVVTAEKATEYLVWDTRFTEASLTAELKDGGFRPEAFYGDACGAPRSSESGTLCCIARRA